MASRRAASARPSSHSSPSRRISCRWCAAPLARAARHAAAMPATAAPPSRAGRPRGSASRTGCPALRGQCGGREVEASRRSARARSRPVRPVPNTRSRRPRSARRWTGIFGVPPRRVEPIKAFASRMPAESGVIGCQIELHRERGLGPVGSGERPQHLERGAPGGGRLPIQANATQLGQRAPGSAQELRSRLLGEHGLERCSEAEPLPEDLLLAVQEGTRAPPLSIESSRNTGGTRVRGEQATPSPRVRRRLRGSCSRGRHEEEQGSGGPPRSASLAVPRALLRRNGVRRSKRLEQLPRGVDPAAGRLEDEIGLEHLAGLTRSLRAHEGVRERTWSGSGSTPSRRSASTTRCHCSAASANAPRA